MSKFVPRAFFPKQLSLPRSYFLGHHKEGFDSMRRSLASIDLVIECRDYRVPLSSRNHLFEEALAGRKRLIVYTKRDLGSKHRPSDYAREDVMKSWHRPSPVLFCSNASRWDVNDILEVVTQYANAANSLTGCSMMVVGMPNVGKSSLLNALRTAGTKRAKVARTGDQPGVTRKFSTWVKIVDQNKAKEQEAIYMVDTPGVFIPYVPDPEAMLKLALVGSVKDTVIDPIVLVDYLLYALNKKGMSEVYKKFMPEGNPTNEVDELLEGVCKRTGKMKRGGKPDIDAAAFWMLQKFRHGSLGRLVLDEIEDGGLEKAKNQEPELSISQAKRMKKKAMVEKNRSRVRLVDSG